LRRAVIFNYNSLFAKDIERTIKNYNFLNPERALQAEILEAGKYPIESMAGQSDVILHSGGDGNPIKEDISVPKLYICHSHQWKAKTEGGTISRLKSYRKGIHLINVLEDDDIMGKKGKIPIMQYHILAVTHPPARAKVLALSRAIDEHGKEIQVIEALRYPDGSLSIQGHAEEGTASHIFYNFFNYTQAL